MIHQKIKLNEIGSENAFATPYILQTNHELPIKKRPTVVICPGGGYKFVSYREDEPVALQFLARGYNAVILHYSVSPATYPTALLELGRVILMLRERADLTASYSCFWTKDILPDTLGCNKDMQGFLLRKKQDDCPAFLFYFVVCQYDFGLNLHLLR